MKKSTELLIAAAGGTAARAIVDQMSQLEVSRYTLSFRKLPREFDGLKIVHLSDLHNKKYGCGDCELYFAVMKEAPDMIFMTGDMISHAGENREDFFRLVESLSEKVPVFYVNGNHECSDLGEDDFAEMTRRFSEAGIICLDNTFVTLYRGRSALNLYGLCYTAEYYKGVRQHKFNWNDFTLAEMTRFCGEKSSDDFTILLAHNPLDFDVHAEWGADLSFGGHIHGGFIRLPLVKGIISPELKLFPKYKEGVYKNGSSALVVSRGLGRIRFFNPPELVTVTLKSK